MERKTNQRFLDHFDGVISRTIFCFWTGDEVMSTDRLQALWSIYQTTACPVMLINKGNLHEWIKCDAPLHPAYPYLSSTHKADYLRVYFMHHYGGGYTDIKRTQASWHSFFTRVERSSAVGLGYAELPHGMPHIKGARGEEYKRIHNELIGLCAFIFKKNTFFTDNWLNKTHDLLNQRLEALMEHPARTSLDQAGLTYSDGTLCLYPLRWAEMLGEIFHPLVYEHRNQLLKDVIAPVFHSYR